MSHAHAVSPAFLLVSVLLFACEGGRTQQAIGDAGARDAALAPIFAPAGQCLTLVTGAGRAIARDGASYREDPASATAFRFQPASLGAYLLLDPEGGLLSLDSPADPLLDPGAAVVEDLGQTVSGSSDLLNIVHPLVAAGDALGALGLQIADLGVTVSERDQGNAIAPRQQPHRRSVWYLYAAEDGVFRLQSAASGQWLGLDESGVLEPVAAADAALDLRLEESAAACADFPEIASGASGRPYGGERAEGELFGLADTHVHLMASDRLGGRVIHGEAFHPLGVTAALDDCAIDHGPEGSLDGIGNFQREGQPLGTHATEGWPTFDGWPVRDTLSHQQTYHAWLERAWMAGLRLVVNHFNADEALCHVAPRRSHGCDEFQTALRQRVKLQRLQDYIDALHGGPGQGWLRIVTSPAQAREVVAAGKLAVVMGVESSKPFGCGEFLDAPECTREDIRARLDEFEALGIRSLFLAHWFDNALGGPGLFGPTELALNAFNKLETGHYYRVEKCPVEGIGANQQSVGVYQDGDDLFSAWLNEAQMAAVPTYGEGPHCNQLGLTVLGEFLVEEIMRRGMLIEFDHLSYNTKERLLSLAERHRYPLIAGHLGTGGVTTDQQLSRLYAIGGLASPFNDRSDRLIDKVLAQRQFAHPDHYFGVGFASDSGGLASQPPAREDVAERPLVYPFTSFDGQVRFERQRSGERVYDLNQDGVAHYGLYADLLADMRQQSGGQEALALMARAAEAYIRMWERAERRAREWR